MAVGLVRANISESEYFKSIVLNPRVTERIKIKTKNYHY